MTSKLPMILIKLFDLAGYENIFYAMIFVPISIIIFICLLIGVMVVLNRKRFVHKKCFVTYESSILRKRMPYFSRKKRDPVSGKKPK